MEQFDITSLISPAIVKDDVARDSAIALARISKLSYEPDDDVHQTLLEWGFTHASPVSVGPQHAWLAFHPAITVLAFRGTNESADWIANIDILPERVPRGRIHRGFFHGYASLKVGIAAELTTRHDPQAKLWITGHSLGGALAIVSAHDFLMVNNRELFGLYTFGQPAVVAGEFTNKLADEVGKDYVRFVNESDIVTRIPPFYHHFGHRVWFRNGGVEQEMEASVLSVGSVESQAGPLELRQLNEAEFQRLQMEIRGQVAVRSHQSMILGGAVPLVRDHSMSEYILKLIDYANSEPMSPDFVSDPLAKY